MYHSPSGSALLCTSAPTALDEVLPASWTCEHHQWSPPKPQKGFQHSCLHRNHTPCDRDNRCEVTFIGIHKIRPFIHSHSFYDWWTMHFLYMFCAYFVHTWHRLSPVKQARIHSGLWSGQRLDCRWLLVACHQWWLPPIFQTSKTREREGGEYKEVYRKITLHNPHLDDNCCYCKVYPETIQPTVLLIKLLVLRNNSFKDEILESQSSNRCEKPAVPWVDDDHWIIRTVCHADMTLKSVLFVLEDCYHSQGTIFPR